MHISSSSQHLWSNSNGHDDSDILECINNNKTDEINSSFCQKFTTRSDHTSGSKDQDNVVTENNNHLKQSNIQYILILYNNECCCC